MAQKHAQRNKNKVLTIPNILSLCRIALIPVFVWQYCVQHRSILTGYLLILSGLTDVADGFIARRFHMVSNLGKVLDPIADKLTQGAMLTCLLVRFPQMLAPLILMLVKETFMVITGWAIIKQTGIVLSAQWHGKASTCLLYGMMFLHVFLDDIPKALSEAMVWGCFAMILLSFALYVNRNFKALTKKLNNDRR